MSHSRYESPSAVPSIGQGGPQIPHYYGDYVRVLFVIAAIVLIVAAVAFRNLQPPGIVLELAVAVILLILAGLTHPHSRTIMTLNAIAAGIGTIAAGTSAAMSLQTSSFFFMFLALGFAITLGLALYFSVKSVRAMMLHTIGREYKFGEFVENDEVKE